MKLPSKPSAVSSVVVVALAAVLIVLAALQYRWSREVSEAAGARMKAGLQTSMMSFRVDLHREVGSIAAAFQADPEENAHDRLTQYAQRYASWSRTGPYPGLIANLFVLQGAGGKDPRLVRLDRATDRFEPAAWPSEFSMLQERIMTNSADFAAMAARFRPAPDDAQRRAAAAPGRPPNAERHGPLGPPWALDENLPALVHPVVIRAESARPYAAASPATMDWLILEIDRKFLEERLLPEFAERHFSGADGLEYQVAILSGNDRKRVIYSSDHGFGSQGEAGNDATLDMFGGPMGGPGRGIFLPRQSAGDNARRDRFETRQPRIEPLRYAAQDKDWLLIVKHRRGSLEAVVTGMRRRSLGISFGVLLVLAATMAMIIVASQRAHRLAKLQIDFVAGVSHELRTPLAVIGSAADNLADGVVDNPEQLTRYGKVIKKQAAQLTALVEQILLFAATRKDRLTYSVRPLAVEEVVATALSNTGELIHGAGFNVEQMLEPNLPPVLGDHEAVARCLQNLITNAVKYGGADHWIGIRTGLGEENGRGPEVRISIEDHGAGIARAELQRIFEPFYRSPAVTAAQIHGSGLGLPLAKSIAEAVGGRLTVASQPGQGSSFTLHLRAAAGAVIAAEAPAAVHSGVSPQA